jgi:hypothetical protein
MPVWASIDYSYTDQEGSMSAMGGVIPSRTRNAVILTLGGSFVFGKGTPPIFHGL